MSKEGFESVAEISVNWNPKSTGSKKEGSFKELKAGDDSYVIGYYLGTKTGVGKHNSNVHQLQLKEVGNDSHLSGPAAEGSKIDVWGSGVLDTMITENVNPGELIMITWKGLTKPKKEGGATYHGWDVGVNRNVEPLNSTIPNMIPESGSIDSEDRVKSNANVEVSSSEEDDDDLPF